jgi:branched-chain amino acid transport system ATP-binding protein
MRMLKIEDLHVYYGEVHALRGVSLEVRQGEVVTLLGNNGAGKTTTLKTISGLLAAKQGHVEFEGKSLAGIPAHDVVGLGIAHVPEGRRIFKRLSVRENLSLGAFLRNDRAIAEDMERVLSLFPVLRERIKQVAGTLSGGEQQMLAVGRAMMARPRLLLLDEPSMGLSPVMTERIFDTIVSINRAGTTVMLVEQNASMALAIAQRAYVIETGAIVLAGTAKELAGNDQVRRAYLGQ